MNKMKSKPAEIVLLIKRINIAPGHIEITLNAQQLSTLFGMTKADINTEALTIKLPFQTRKRGVETKLIIGHVAPETDSTLICNLATSHKWLGMIKLGKSLDDIAV